MPSCNKEEFVVMFSNFKKCVAFTLIFCLISQPISVLGAVSFQSQNSSNAFTTVPLTDEMREVLRFYGIDENEYVESRGILAVTIGGIKAAFLALRGQALKVSMTTHVVTQMTLRGFNNDRAARILHSGQRFIDNRGSRILFDPVS